MKREYGIILPWNPEERGYCRRQGIGDAVIIFRRYRISTSRFPLAAMGLRTDIQIEREINRYFRGFPS